MLSTLMKSVEVTILEGSRLQFTGPMQWGSVTSPEPYFRIYLVMAGRADMSLDGHLVPLQAKTMYLVPPRAKVHHKCQRQLDIIWFHATLRIQGCIDIFDLVTSLTHRKVNDIPSAVRDMQTVIAGVESSPNPISLTATMHAYGTLLRLLAPFVTIKDASMAAMQRIAPAIVHMDSNLHRVVSLAEFAQVTGYDSRHFCTLFKRLMGETPMQHFHRRRIDRVRLLLSKTDDSIAAIADTMGYSDAFHLSKTFKRITGTSPSAFRAAAAQEPMP